MYDKVRIKAVVTLANNGVSYIFNQTMSGGQTLTTTPGDGRMWTGGRLLGVIGCTTQNVTLRSFLLDGTTWVADSNGPGAGSLVITAGTTVPFDWKINGIGRMDILNGATGPSVLAVTGFHWNPDMEPGA